MYIIFITWAGTEKWLNSDDCKSFPITGSEVRILLCPLCENGEIGNIKIYQFHHFYFYNTGILWYMIMLLSLQYIHPIKMVE